MLRSLALLRFRKVRIPEAGGDKAPLAGAVKVRRCLMHDSHMKGVNRDPAACRRVADCGLAGAVGQPCDHVKPGRRATDRRGGEPLRERSDERIPACVIHATGTTEVAVDLATLEERRVDGARVRRRGGRCVLNLAPALPIDLALLPEIDLLVANESEAATMSSDPMGMARRLR